jgi:5'-deoxynucleotidase YfbR-like HD superfamily hydrolase
MGVMSLLASDCSVDATRCMKMALVHDVAEAIVGDITPHCSVSDEDKFSMESQAIHKIKDMLGQETQAGQAHVAALKGVVTSPASFGCAYVYPIMYVGQLQLFG